jgi:acyl-CoA dehydrogenase
LIVMSDKSYLDWPFFEDRHRKLERELDAWAGTNIGDHHESDVDAACRTLVAKLGAAGWPRHAIGGTAYGGVAEVIDTRAICLIRETLARHSGLADFAFAMQGLGSGAITLYGTEEQKRAYLPRAASGEAIAAFALSEPDAGSDVAALRCAARDDGDAYVLNGEKTWISNGGIADFYVVFVRTGEGEGSRGISAFIVDAGAPGFTIAERIEVIAPHPLARLKFTDCRIPKSRLLGVAGEGFKIAMSNLDVFRSPLPRRRSALPGAPSMRRSSARPRAGCSGRRSPTFSSPRRSSRRWRQRSMLRRCLPTAPPGCATRARPSRARRRWRN